jgi:hypothetical protein
MNSSDDVCGIHSSERPPGSAHDTSVSFPFADLVFFSAEE